MVNDIFHHTHARTQISPEFKESFYGSSKALKEEAGPKSSSVSMATAATRAAHDGCGRALARGRRFL